jgi:hypothetical protein
MSELSRVVGVILSPVKTFQDIARKPTWLVPLLILVVAAVLSNAMTIPRFDWEGMAYERAEQLQESRGIQLSDEQIESQIQMTKKIGPLFAYIGAVVFLPIIYLIVALVYFGVIKIGKGGITYIASFAVVCFSGLPGAIRLLLSGFAALSRESINQAEAQTLVPSNLSVFLDRDQVGALAYSLSQYVDVFAIWGIVLAAIGLAAASSWSKGKCAALVVIFYVLAALLFGGLASLAG